LISFLIILVSFICVRWVLPFVAWLFGRLDKPKRLTISLGRRVLLVRSLFKHRILLRRPSKVLTRWHAELLIIVVH
jgi:hypothetical protein